MLEAFNKLSDEDILEALIYSPNYLQVVSNVITIENEINKQKEKNELYKFS